MDERDAKAEPGILLTEDSGEDGATDIVGRTGEEMPLAMHDQGHSTFQAAAPEEAFDPRLQNRRPRPGIEKERSDFRIR
jgi:hypothetical protein